MCRAWADTTHDHRPVVLGAGPGLAFSMWTQHGPAEIISYRAGLKKVRPKHDVLAGTTQLSALHTHNTNSAKHDKKDKCIMRTLGVYLHTRQS